MQVSPSVYPFTRRPEGFGYCDLLKLASPNSHLKCVALANSGPACGCATNTHHLEMAVPLLSFYSIYDTCGNITQLDIQMPWWGNKDTRRHTGIKEPCSWQPILATVSLTGGGLLPHNMAVPICCCPFKSRWPINTSSP